MTQPQPPLVAVDIGNNRIKLGLFGPRQGANLPSPDRTWAVDGDGSDLDGIADQLPAGAKLRWWIGSVNRPAPRG